jgi:hypothetical protein
MGLPVIDNYIDRYTPMAKELGVDVRSYADRFMARFDVIIRELEELTSGGESTQIVRNWVSDNTKPFILGTLTSDEVWTMQAVVGSGVATTLTFRQDGQLRCVSQVGGPYSSPQVPNIIIRGPGEVIITATDNGTEIYLQFQQSRRDVSQKTNRNGFENPLEIDRLGLAPTHRHMSSAA